MSKNRPELRTWAVELEGVPSNSCFLAFRFWEAPVLTWSRNRWCVVSLFRPLVRGWWSALYHKCIPHVTLSYYAEFSSRAADKGFDPCIKNIVTLKLSLFIWLYQKWNQKKQNRHVSRQTPVPGSVLGVQCAQMTKQLHVDGPCGPRRLVTRKGFPSDSKGTDMPSALGCKSSEWSSQQQRQSELASPVVWTLQTTSHHNTVTVKGESSCLIICIFKHNNV